MFSILFLVGYSIGMFVTVTVIKTFDLVDDADKEFTTIMCALFWPLVGAVSLAVLLVLKSFRFADAITTTASVKIKKFLRKRSI